MNESPVRANGFHVWEVVDSDCLIVTCIEVRMATASQWHNDLLENSSASLLWTRAISPLIFELLTMPFSKVTLTVSMIEACNPGAWLSVCLTKA